MAREDTYLEIRGHLAELTDEELEARFWELAQRVVDPMVELARTHTSPSIERSVLIDTLQVQQVLLNLFKNAWDAQQAAGEAWPIEVGLDRTF